MSFASLRRVLTEELPEADAARVIRRLTLELAGLRISIPAAPRLTDDEIYRALRASGWNVAQAAKRLDVHRSAIYRRLQARQRR